MAEKPTERRGLGRGLSALMGDSPQLSDLAGGKKIAPDRAIPIEEIAPNPDQPRKYFEETALNDLAASIEEKGIIQPIIVREVSDRPAKYEIVAGERRWRAAQLARLHEVPAIVRSFSDEEAMEVAIIENIQRDDLNPMEESRGYELLMEAHGRTQEEMAKALGKSRSYIANSLRLLNLPLAVQNYVVEGSISAGHARALVASDDPFGLANIVISKGLSVRETERLVKAEGAPPRQKKKAAPAKDADTRALEDELSASLGARVSIDMDGRSGAGRLSVKFRSFDELDDLCRHLSNVRI